jgi:hypothetical protein
MLEHWQLVALGTLALLAVYPQIRAHQIQRESKKRELLFQIVTENAAALVDGKGNRLYNSRRISGFSAIPRRI